MKIRLYIIIGIISLSLFVPSFSYGLWVSQSFEELLEQSETIFVGTIQSVNVLDFEKSNIIHAEENGISKIIIENYTQSLDEYTVSIEEFIKNPQESNTITMLEGTVGGVPGRDGVSIGGFELNERVLFFVPKLDGTNQYSPESFKIPKQCDVKTILDQAELEFGNKFRTMQNGIQIDNNFAANIPIEFVYYQGYHKLGEKNFDVYFKIIKLEENNKNQTVIDETVHIEFKECEWKSVANIEFIPSIGKYSMSIETGNSGSFQSFTVIENESEPKCAPGPVLENGTCGACERGFILFEGECRKITHGESPPISFDEPHHPIPYIQNTSLNQMSIIMLIVIAAIGGCLISLFYFWRKIK